MTTATVCFAPTHDSVGNCRDLVLVPWLEEETWAPLRFIMELELELSGWFSRGGGRVIGKGEGDQGLRNTSLFDGVDG